MAMMQIFQRTIMLLQFWKICFIFYSFKIVANTYPIIFGNTASRYTSKGKLRLSAIKANCSKNFILCDKETPTPLASGFKIIQSKTEIETVAPFYGSCLSFSYKYEKDTVQNLELNEVSCAANNLLPQICEFVVE
jgi:hypothetical protein